MNHDEESPNAVLEKLKKSPPAGDKAANRSIDFTLGYKGKYFIISWNVVNPQRWDWIGIYENGIINKEAYRDYQWVTRTSPYRTKVKVNAGYQARYYCWDSNLDRYLELARTELFPKIEMRSSTNFPDGVRPIESKEFNDLKKIFPNLKLQNTSVTGEATDKYNCIAWSLGFDDKWINPGSTKDILTRQYLSYGCSATGYSSASAVIDAWAYSTGKGTHGSKKYAGSASLYESKLGRSLRITHGRTDLESTAYGSIFQSFTARVVFKANAMPAPKVVFHSGDGDKLKEAVNAVPEEIRSRFEERFATWKSNWFTDELVFSTDTKDRVKAEGYDELLSMGGDIIPLVIEKLNEEENFIALVLYEDLQKDKSLLIRYAEDEPLHILLEGEQTRAKRAVKLWLNRVVK